MTGVRSFYMTGHIGQGGGANLVTSVDLAPHSVAITRIFVPYDLRGQGIGSQMLNMVIADADSSDITLCLEVQPDDSDLNYDQLVAWYQRHGFKWWVRYPGLMIRRPQ